jgi:acetolactate synthase-1/2/3 large subunit
VLETLQELTAGRSDVIWTTGVGQHQMWAMQYLQCDRPRSFITSGGLGTMGYGIPAAVGAKAARPDATVVCVDGDGCFQMTAQELATSVLEELPIIVVIVNNGYLGMVRQWQELFWDGKYSHVDTGEFPDFVKLAEAYGATGMRFEDKTTLVADMKRAIATDGPVLVDVRVTREENTYPMIPAGQAAREMVG